MLAKCVILENAQSNQTCCKLIILEQVENLRTEGTEETSLLPNSTSCEASIVENSGTCNNCEWRISSNIELRNLKYLRLFILAKVFLATPMGRCNIISQ